jgi:hypothetical protein
MRLTRFRLRTLMIAVAVVALYLASLGFAAQFSAQMSHVPKPGAILVSTGFEAPIGPWIFTTGPMTPRQTVWFIWLVALAVPTITTLSVAITYKITRGLWRLWRNPRQE